MPIAPRLTLAPDRKRMAKSMRKLFRIIDGSDAKLYARGKPFLPIFPTDNVPLGAAINVVIAQLEAVINPP